MDEDDFPAWPAHGDDDQPDESAPADEAKEEGETASEDTPSEDGSDAVSYTHLTLPTIYSV